MPQISPWGYQKSITQPLDTNTGPFPRAAAISAWAAAWTSGFGECFLAAS